MATSDDIYLAWIYAVCGFDHPEIARTTKALQAELDAGNAPGWTTAEKLTFEEHCAGVKCAKDGSLRAYVLNQRMARMLRDM